MINFQRHRFAPAVRLPAEYDVLDFSGGTVSGRTGKSAYAIGRYNEVRPGEYTAAQFEQGRRQVHMGIDIGAPAGTPVFSVMEGKVLYAANNAAPQDYGYTLVLEYSLEGQQFYVLYGHLGAATMELVQPGQPVEFGGQIGVIGNEQENGGWPPHLHFQIALQKPERADLPGVVSKSQREEACRIYPDPRLILGPLY